MKKRFLFVFALLTLLTITGCGEKDKKLGTLATPQEITIQSDGSKSLIIFDEVENADYYNIYINDMPITVKANGSGTIQFDASKIITLPQKYIIKVKAGGNDYFDSKFSEDYEYNHTSILDAPVIHIDGTTLNWSKIANAQFYDVLIKTNNPSLESIHRFPTNKFNFENILTNKGEYVFKVRAVSENGEYLTSIYSNQVTYTHTIKLITPYNLKTTYDLNTNEMLLSFVSSENVSSFTIKINGTNYNVEETELNRILYQEDLDNVYVLKLSSFIKSKNIKIDNSQIINVSIKANARGQYYESSQMSNEIGCQFTSVLGVPQISLSQTATTCKININATESSYLSGFAIYLNDRKYKTITKEVTQIELPLTELGNAGIRVQAVSNNNNCCSSQLSDVKYIDNSIDELNNTNINFENGIITWDSVENATKYYVEISNTIYKYAQITDDTALDINDICVPNNYKVRVIAIADGFKQSEKSATISHIKKLEQITNINITTITDNTYLCFDEVDGCYGYVIYLNNVMVNQLFTSTSINISPYVTDAYSYKIKVRAINVIDGPVQDGEISEEQILQNIKTLSSPLLSIVKVEDKYYLNIDIDETESTMSSGYEVWINYVSIGELVFQDKQIDITSYFTNAGRYNFMVKAKAIDSNQYIKDSTISSITYTCTKQLDTVTDINVTELSDEGTYILTFKEQTFAAKYVVTILKADDAQYKAEFEINSGVADISNYVKANGVYRVYVKAIALENGFYTDSAASGNPYRLTKGETLPIVSNVSIAKRTGATSNGEIDITWDKVANSKGYQVYIYYNNNGKSTLIKSVYVAQANKPTLNIGSGENKSLNKEGQYTISIKALGDGKNYETSQLSNTPYTYIMQTEADFTRNTIFMNGNVYDYKVNNLDDLKNLLWYHYLYNDDVWLYNTLEYNLKINCSLDLDKLASEISESFANRVQLVNTNAQKMDLIAKELLNKYTEAIAYNDGLVEQGMKTQPFCLNEERGVYIFRYQDILDKVKTTSVDTNNQLYNEKIETISVFDQRSTNYVFKVDTKDCIDVTTTEQLFMALQYNKRPNFVGDSKVAQAVYENARFILRSICSDEMSDYEKLLQIYDFLTKRITYNSSVSVGNMRDTIMLDDGSYVMRGNIKQFYLETILYNDSVENGLFTNLDEFIGKTASSSALAKTLVVLCSIEGITSIKVDGTSSEGKYSWNKVFIDIEDDGHDGKLWYVVDLTSAIKYKFYVTKNSNTQEYQASLHRYFLITDATLNAQATSWHTPLGATTDYKAITSFDYYNIQRYSCEYEGNQLVSNKNFKVADDNDAKHALMYAMLKANKKHRIIIDIDAEIYIRSIVGNSTDASSLNTVTSKITNNIYEAARQELGGKYNCNVTATIVDAKYIIISVESVNYTE